MRFETLVMLFIAAFFIAIVISCYFSIVKIHNRQWAEWNAKIRLIENHLSNYDLILRLIKEGLTSDEILKIIEKDGDNVK